MSFRILQGKQGKELPYRTAQRIRRVIQDSHLAYPTPSTFFSGQCEIRCYCWDPFSNYLPAKHQIDAALVQGPCSLRFPPQEADKRPIIEAPVEVVIKCRRMAIA